MGREMLMRAFLDPFQYRRLRFEGQNYGWHEYGISRDSPAMRSDRPSSCAWRLRHA